SSLLRPTCRCTRQRDRSPSSATTTLQPPQGPATPPEPVDCRVSGAQQVFVLTRARPPRDEGRPGGPRPPERPSNPAELSAAAHARAARVASIAPSSRMLCLRGSGIRKPAIRKLIAG